MMQIIKRTKKKDDWLKCYTRFCWVLILFISFNSYAGDAEQEDFTVAIKAFEDGLYDLSQQQFQLFLEKYSRSSRRAKAQFLLGEIAFQRKEYTRAQREFQKYLERYPNHRDREDALFRLGRSYFLRGSYLTAARTYQRIPSELSSSKSVGTAFYWAGECFYLAQKYEQSLTEFNNSIKYKATNTFYEYSLFRRGLCYLEMKQYEKAIDDFNTVSQLDFDEEIVAESHFLLLKCYFLNSDYGIFVTEALRREESIKPSQKPELLIMIATAYLKDNHPLESINFLETRLHNDKTLAKDKSLYPEILYLLGLSYLQSKQYEKGVDYFTRLIDEFTIVRQAEESLVNLAYIYIQMGQIEEAEQYYKQYLDRYPSGSMKKQVLQGLGNLYRNVNRFDESISAFEKALKLSSYQEEGALRLMLADTYAAANNYDKALQIYEAIIEKYKDQSSIIERAYLQIGLCYYKKGDFDKAIMQFQTFIIHYNDSPLINKSRYWLGETYFQTGDYSSAEVTFQEYLRHSDETILTNQVEEKIAFAFFKEKKWKLALEYYQRLEGNLGQTAKGEDLLLQIGRCHENLNQISEAIKIYYHFLEDYPKSARSLPVKLALAQLLLEQQDGTRSIDILNTISIDDLSSEDQWVYYTLRGRSFDLAGNYSQSEIEYKKALDVDATPVQLAQTRYLLAQNYFLLDRDEDGFNNMQLLINEQAQTDYAIQAMRQFVKQADLNNDHERALMMLDHVIETDRTKIMTVEALYQSALQYSSLGKFDQALLKLNQIIQSYKEETLWYERALVRAGLICEGQKMINKAKQYYLTLLSQGSSSELVQSAKERLARIESNESQDINYDELFKNRDDVMNGEQDKQGLLKQGELQS